MAAKLARNQFIVLGAAGEAGKAISAQVIVDACRDHMAIASAYNAIDALEEFGYITVEWRDHDDLPHLKSKIVTITDLGVRALEEERKVMAQV